MCDKRTLYICDGRLSHYDMQFHGCVFASIIMAFHRVPTTAVFARTFFNSHPRPRLRIRLKNASAGESRSLSTSGKAHATHKDTPPSSLLSQALEQRQRLARNSQQDNVGPFNLGMTQQSMGVGEAPLKKWKELDTKGKGMCIT